MSQLPIPAPLPSPTAPIGAMPSTVAPPVGISPMMAITPQRLAKADRQSERLLKPHRDNRASAIQEYLGRWYDDGDNKKRPLNLLAQYANIIVPNLVGRLPSNSPKARNPMLRFEATLLGLALDDLQERLDLYTFYRMMAFDAIFSPCAICKVGIKAGAELYKIDGRSYDPGAIYVSPIDFDDFGFDPTAKNRESVGWERHQYYPILQDVLDSGVFAGKEDLLISLPKMGQRTQSSDEHPSDRNEDLGPDRYAVDRICLRDYAIYEKGRTRIVTMAGGKAAESQTEFLADVEFEGPDGGPYEQLCFNPVSTAYLGVPPVAFIRDIAEAGERITNKMIRQAERAKQVFVYSKSASDDAMTLRKAADGDAVGVDNAESVKPIVYGGVDPQNYDFSAWMNQQFNNLSGSAQMLSGTEKIADTATEAQIMQANASARLREMKDRMESFMDRVTARLGWFLTVDPLIKLPLPYRLPGGETVEAVYSAEEREGCWYDFNFKVRRGSAVGIDPMVRIKRIGDMLTILQNFIPLGQAGLVNIPGLGRLLGAEYDVDNLDEILNDPMLMMQLQSIVGAIPGVPNPQLPGMAGGMPGAPMLPGGPQMGGGIGTPPTPPGAPGISPPAKAQAGRMGGSPAAPRPDSANPADPAVRGGYSQGGAGGRF